MQKYVTRPALWILFTIAAWFASGSLVLDRAVLADEIAPAAAKDAGPVASTPLAGLVPEDVGLFVEVENLAEHSQRLLRGSFYRRFEQFPPVAAWHAENARRLDQIAGQVARQLGMTSDELWSKLLSHQAALGVWPASSGSATDSKMLLMVEAGDDGVLDRVVESFCQAQQRVGDITEAREVKYAGSGYQVRVLRRDGVDFPIYLSAVGRVGILTGDEGIVRRVLELHADTTRAGSLAALPNYRASQLRLRPEAAVRMFVNPRSWEAAIKVAFDVAGDEVGLIETAFLETWKIADYWVASAEIRSDSILVESFFAFDREQLPQPLRDLERSLEGKAHFLERVPPDAALAFAGRIDLGRLSRMFLANGGASEQNLAQVRDLARGLLMGLDIFDDLLVNLGPEVGTFLTPAPAGAQGEKPAADVASADDPAETPSEVFPIELVIGVEAQPRPAGDRRPPVTQVLDTALRTAMQLLAGQRAGDEVPKPDSSNTADSKDEESTTRVQTEKVAGGTLTYLEGIPGMPAGFVMTYAVVGNYFFGGTSPDAVRRAIEMDPAASLAASPRVRSLISPRMTDPSQVVYVDCRVLRSLLKQHPQLFVNLVQLTRGLDGETAERGLSQLANLLELAETVVFAGKFDEYGLAFSFGISLDESATLGE